jgi:methylglutaconyl-CoA hydratase
MSDTLVHTSCLNGVARIVLSRADKRNALSRELLRQLSEAVHKTAADPSARLLVLAADGPVFCAGMDLGEMQDAAGRPDARDVWQNDTQIYLDLVRTLYRLAVPTLAVVQGPVLAGGVGLVAACDLVVASEKASVALPEPKRGITAAIVLPLLLLRVGPAAAGWLLMSGESWSADTACRRGLFHDVVTPENLASRVDALIASILGGSPAALAITKRHLQACASEWLEWQLAAGMRLSAQARETSDAREGLAAFLEKRPPAWTPRGEL